MTQHTPINGSIILGAGHNVWSQWLLLAKVRRRTRQYCLNCEHTTEGNIGDFVTYLAQDTFAKTAPGEKPVTRTFTAADVHERYARLMNCFPSEAERYIPQLPIVIKDSIVNVNECANCIPKMTEEPIKSLPYFMPELLPKHEPAKNTAKSTPPTRHPVQEEIEALRRSAKRKKGNSRRIKVKGPKPAPVVINSLTDILKG